MSIRLRIAKALGGRPLAARIEGAQEDAVARYKESVPIGMGIDSDDYLYRRAGGAGGTVRRLPDHLLNRSRELAWRAWVTNAMARRVVGIIVDYLVGEGVTVDSPNEDVRRVLRRFWRDPVNNFPLTLPRRAMALYLFGEQHYPATVLEQTGHVRLSYADPRDIMSVVLDPENAAFACGLIVRRTWGHRDSAKLRIIGADDEYLSNTGREVMKEFRDGRAFSFRINCLPNSDRGQTELMAVLDWMDNYEEGLFDSADRARLMMNIVYDLQMEGAEEGEIRKRLAELDFTKPNFVYGHNERETLSQLSPHLPRGDKSNFWRMPKNHILGAMGLPEYFFGEGDSANRATAVEQGAPTLKMLTRKQLELKEMLISMLAFAVREALHAGYISGREIEIETVEDLIQVTFPELSVRDVQKAASAYQSVTQGIMTMAPQGLISVETAVETLSVLHEHLGVYVSAADEKDRLEISDVLDALGPYATDPEAAERLQQMAEAIRGNGGDVQ